MQHEDYMRIALKLAREGADAGEVPVGCVIVDGNGDICGRGRNMREEKQSALSHAETEAIADACRNRNNWRLNGCSIYITAEPCPMCAGAIINARISKVFYGTREDNFGSCGSVINLFMERYGHYPQIVGGILEDECKALLRDFFEKVRG